MEKNYFLLLLTALFAVVSCNHDVEQIVCNPTDVTEEAIADGNVPFSRAISNADFVFKNIEGVSAKKRKVRSVDVLTRPNANSSVVRARSSFSSNEEDKPIAYVVNYENNDGFAILAADTKLPPVISIGDEGNFNTNEFLSFIQNRNTTRSNSPLNPAQEIQYAVISNSLMLPSINVGGANIIEGRDTTVMLKCLPLVPTKWGQQDPYNYCAPPNSSKPSGRSDAGCVPLAGAQIFASLCYHHNWRPTVQLSNEFPVDWYLINEILHSKIYSFEIGDYSENSLAVASLIRAVGAYINANYYNGNYTTSDNAMLVYAFNLLGLSEAQNQNSNTQITKNEIFNMIVNKNIPLAAQGECDGMVYGHSFVLDGLLRLEYSIAVTKHISDELVGGIGYKRDLIRYHFDLVHVNFGWEGRCDGYYLPDAFDLTKTKYKEYSEESDSNDLLPYVFDLDVEYLTYEL